MDAFRLNIANLIENTINTRHVTYIYGITVTPKGKNKLHSDYTHELRRDIRQMKSIKYCFLFKEYTHTRHIHGIIATNRKLTFKKLLKNKLYTFNYKRLTQGKDGYLQWALYITKEQEKHETYYYYQQPNDIFTTCSPEL